MGLAVGIPTLRQLPWFSSTDQSLDPQYFIAIDLAWCLFFSDFTTLVIGISHRLLVQPKNFIEVFYKIGKAESHLHQYRYVTRSLEATCTFMTLVDQPINYPHGNDISSGWG